MSMQPLLLSVHIVKWYQRNNETMIQFSKWDDKMKNLCFTPLYIAAHYAIWAVICCRITGNNQSVIGCGSQRRQCSCYSTKTHINSMILILKLNLTSLWETYTLKVVFVEQHTHSRPSSAVWPVRPWPYHFLGR